MRKKPSQPPLSFAQYARIHHVVYSLAQYFTKDEGRECVFYSINAAAIMREHYGKDARVACGLGAVVVDRSGNRPTAVSWFAIAADQTCVATRDAFHCWVECDNWVIDFSAPNYQRTLDTSPLAKDGAVPRVGRRMLQKPMEGLATSSEQLTRVGRAMFDPDPDLTQSIIGNAFAKPSTADVAGIACAFHRPVPHPMPPSMTVVNDLGEIATIPLIERELVGMW